MSDQNSVLELLVKSVSSDGGWGYRTDQPTHLEPTCLALLALSAQPEKYKTQIEAGFNALQQHYYITHPQVRVRISGAVAILAIRKDPPAPDEDDEEDEDDWNDDPPPKGEERRHPGANGV